MTTKRIDLIKKVDCTGCAACAVSCPVGCIKMIADKEGFLYPNIEYGDCINCEECYDSCPILKSDDSNKNKISPKIYALQHLNSKTRFLSSSGGAFSLIGDAVLKKGGFVAGVRFAVDNKKVFHYLISDSNQLDLLRRSF